MWLCVVFENTLKVVDHLVAFSRMLGGVVCVRK